LSPRPSTSRHTLGQWLTDRARRDPAAIAIEARHERMTYGELRRRAVALAAHLLGSGLGPGDRVATVTENDPDQVALFFASALARLVLVPLNRRLTPAELRAELEVVDPALVAAGAAHADDVATAVRSSTVAPGVCRLEDLRAASVTDSSAGGLGDLEALALEVRDEDPLLVVFTSGTTGRAKGAVLNHANCFWTNLSLDGAVPLTAEDVVLQVLPQHHVGGWNVQPLQAWWKGATVQLEPVFEPDRVLHLVERRRVTTMMGVPTMYLMLAEEPGFAGADLSSLRFVVVGGAAMPPELLEIWVRRGVDVFQGYGLTEASPNVLCLDARDAARYPGCVGRPYSYVDVELRDPEGLRIEGDGVGELWVSGPNVFAGYWGDPAASAEAISAGWLETGDLAERDAHGVFRICGRVKDVFVSGGENVYPAEVEAVLREHPRIGDAAVIGVADRRWGEVGWAFVEQRGGEALSEQEVIDYCRARLAGFKVPREVVVMERIPHLDTGKVDKRRLTVVASDRTAAGERAQPAPPRRRAR
jgi:fatty-acyl-CoA synthase